MKQTNRWKLIITSYIVLLIAISTLHITGLFNSFHRSAGAILFELFTRPVNEAIEPPLSVSYGAIISMLIMPGLLFSFFRLQAATLLTLLFAVAGVVAVPTVAYLGYGVLPFATIGIAYCLGLVLAVALTLIISSAEKELLKNAFARYVSKDVLRDLLKDPDGLSVSGKERDITVLFLDIRGFTSFAEAHDPVLVVKRLNELLEFVADIVMAHKGYIDKYMGDAVMAIWGAPVSDTKQVTHALEAALKIRNTIVAKSQFKVGIGIHHGTAIVGNVGSSTRMDFTAIGDTVNTAARLQSATKELGEEIIVSESVKEKAAKERYSVRMKELGKMLLRGKQQAMKTFALLGHD